MELDKQGAGCCIIDVPLACNDKRNAPRQKWTCHADHTFTSRDTANGGTTRREHDELCAFESRLRQLVDEQRFLGAVRSICEHQAGEHRVLGIGERMSTEVHDFVLAYLLQESLLSCIAPSEHETVVIERSGALYFALGPGKVDDLSSRVPYEQSRSRPTHTFLMVSVRRHKELGAGTHDQLVVFDEISFRGRTPYGRERQLLELAIWDQHQ